jgi:pyruvate dehydrogenase E2 component (dihydrolipoamide acetyltransferase)
VSKQPLTVPDLGGAEQVEIIELLVSAGDSVAEEEGLIVLETDKATMEIPSPSAGEIASMAVKVGDRVSEGDVIGEILIAAGEQPAEASTESVPPASTEPEPEVEAAPAPTGTSEPVTETILVPDLGGAEQVEVIELLAKVGETVDAEQSVMVLESDKASMEIPAGKTGTIEKILMTLGDKVDQGQPMLELKVSAASSPSTTAVKENSKADVEATTRHAAADVASPANKPATSGGQTPAYENKTLGFVHAGPAVRKLAREFGVDLAQVKGSGPRGRVLKDDVQDFVKQALTSPATGGAGLPKVADIDFSKFGPVESLPLNKVKLATAKNMTASWLNVPMVTQFDEADITDLESFRKDTNAAGAIDTKLSLIPFVVKAISMALQEFPQFNSSLSADGQALIYKKYVHIGIAVDTPNGLLVPVIRDTNLKTVTQIAQELTEKAHKAREGKLGLADMQGGCFSISSLGGIGGTAFTPIVNAPEVAILGISKSELKPKWNGSEFMPKLMVPLSLSYDHRVIDGAEAARFSQRIVTLLQDIRQLLL